MRASLYSHCVKRLLIKPPPLEVFINLAAYFLNKIYFKRTSLKFYPISMVIYLTKRCNYSCSFCYAQEALDKRNFKNDLTLPQMEELMQTPFGRKALRVGLLGGEPFLNKDIFRMLRRLKELGKITTVVSNASLITGEKIPMLLDSQLDVLGLSLYDNNRRHVERVVRAIDGKLKYWVQTVIDAGEIGKMESIIEFCLSIGCENLQISNCVPLGEKNQGQPIYEDNEEYLKEEKRLKAKYKGKINISWVQLLPRQPRPRACAMPFSYVHIDNMGNLGACCMRPPDGKKFGNVFQDEDAWNRPYYLKLRQSMYDLNQAPMEECKHCDNLHRDLYRI